MTERDRGFPPRGRSVVLSQDVFLLAPLLTSRTFIGYNSSEACLAKEVSSGGGYSVWGAQTFARGDNDDAAGHDGAGDNDGERGPSSGSETVTSQGKSIPTYVFCLHNVTKGKKKIRDYEFMSNC